MTTRIAMLNLDDLREKCIDILKNNDSGAVTEVVSEFLACIVDAQIAAAIPLAVAAPARHPGYPPPTEQFRSDGGPMVGLDAHVRTEAYIKQIQRDADTHADTAESLWLEALKERLRHGACAIDASKDATLAVNEWRRAFDPRAVVPLATIRSVISDWLSRDDQDQWAVRELREAIGEAHP